jgi:branched-chain amino acid transport system ATP-binding protein
MKREGIAVLLSEQNFDFAAVVADRAYVIERGEIRYDGSMAALEADLALRAQYLTI